ncbi:ABC transporter permease [Cytobacillus depressus]|uniref:ABC transporter permease n=1 Tax=Cytobacillus depressus TaxID=1602942 RepID=A0A6L3V3F3_9BACI|nr:ABC transporter permease [Cytobacillus depressus]KAB2334551.1 ABC transporter permease [Cytobacillus depressus]
MGKIIAICLFELKRTFKNPSAYLLMFAMPLIFTFLFGSLFGGNADQTIQMGIVDEDETELSKQLITQIKKNELITYHISTESEGAELLKQQEIQGIFTIKKGLADRLIQQQKPEITFQHLPSSTVAPIVKQMLNDAVLTMSLQISSAQTGSQYSGENWNDLYQKLAIGAEDQRVLTKVSSSDDASVNVLNRMSYSSAGFSIMFVMMMILSVTGVFIEARNMGIWSRLFTTPVTKFQVMFGYFLSFFTIGWIQFFLLMVMSSVLFDVKWGNPIGLFILISSLLLAVVGLALAIAAFAKTAEQQNAIGTLIIVSTCMLGGVYWPTSITPGFMQTMANFVPQSWAIKGFTELNAGGGAVADILTPVLILLCFAVVFFTVGLSRVRYE